MKIIHTNGENKDFFEIAKMLDADLNESVPERREAGINSTYNIEKYKDIFLIYDKGKAVGSAGLWLHDNEVCELVRVFVDSDYRGHGIGSKLYAKVEQCAKKKGYKQIHLRTWNTTQPAVRLYEKNGFKKIAPKDFKYADKFPASLPLAKYRVYMRKEITG